MSQNFSDPYQPPPMVSGPPASADIDALRNVAFWQGFFSVLGYLVTGLVVIVFTVQVGAAVVSSPGAPALIGTLIAMTMAIGMTILVYFIPSLLLGKASKATRAFGEGRISLGEYATQQKKFWRYTGISISIILSVYLVIVAAFIFLGLIFATRSSF